MLTLEVEMKNHIVLIQLGTSIEAFTCTSIGTLSVSLYENYISPVTQCSSATLVRNKSMAQTPK